MGELKSFILYLISRHIILQNVLPTLAVSDTTLLGIFLHCFLPFIQLNLNLTYHTIREQEGAQRGGCDVRLI